MKTRKKKEKIILTRMTFYCKNLKKLMILLEVASSIRLLKAFLNNGIRPSELKTLTLRE